jgi:hypothetical protein
MHIEFEHSACFLDKILINQINGLRHLMRIMLVLPSDVPSVFGAVDSLSFERQLSPNNMSLKPAKNKAFLC